MLKRCCRRLLELSVWTGFVLSLLVAPVGAAVVMVDPVTPLTNYWSGGEWSVDGDFEGWAVFQIANAVVTNGVLTCDASGADSQISRLNFVGGADLDLGFNDYLDVRLQLPADYLGDVQIYYGDTFYPGIANCAARHPRRAS